MRTASVCLVLLGVLLGGLAWWMADDGRFGPVHLFQGAAPSAPRAAAPEELSRPALSPASWSAHAVPGGCLMAGPSGALTVGLGVFENRRESLFLWGRNVVASGIARLSVGVGGTSAEGEVRLFRHLARMEMAPGSAEVLLVSVALGRPLEISNGRQTLLVRGRMPAEVLKAHRRCVAGLGQERQDLIAPRAHKPVRPAALGRSARRTGRGCGPADHREAGLCAHAAPG
jgi:hypothetical protein